MQKETKDIATLIAEKLTREKIKPIAQWRVTSEKFTYWLVAITLVLLAGFFASFVFLHVRDILTPTFQGRHPRPPMMLFLRVFPYIWLALSLVLVAASLFVIKKAPRGYRYGVGITLFLASVVVFILITLFHLSHVDERAEGFVARQGPRGVSQLVERQWNRPEEGALSGRVTAINLPTFEIISHSGKRWNIITDSNTVFRGKKELAEDAFVTLLGEKSDEETFQAEVVRTLPPRRDRQKEPPVRAKDERYPKMQTYDNKDVLPYEKENASTFQSQSN
ncbi:MAG: hypothetical protein KBD65_02585 [Candidatus Moranbacteria bacterium]|nr:hypothetical protein [Candidatus Moranbacteria bacterium]